MNNFITVKKDILFLEGKVNEIQTKDGNVIQYVSEAEQGFNIQEYSEKLIKSDEEFKGRAVYYEAIEYDH